MTASNATNFAKAFREFGIKEALTQDGEEISIGGDNEDEDILQGRRGRLTYKNFEKLILMNANNTQM